MGWESVGEDDVDCSGGVGGVDVYNGRTEPTLVSLSDSYSDDDSILVCDSRSSSSPAYTATGYLCLLTTALMEL